MGEILFSQLFEKFIYSFDLESDDIQESAYKAVGLIEKEMGIYRVMAHAEIPANSFTPQGMKNDMILFDASGARDIERITPILFSCDYVSSVFKTKEQGVITIACWSNENTGWDDDMKTQIRGMLELLFLFTGRCRLAHQVKLNGILDATTGMLNSDGIMAKGNVLGAKGLLERYACLFINIKNLKMYNQKYGSKVGDALILSFGRALTDYVAEDEIAGRLGGDNFVIVIRKNRLDECLKLLGGVELSVYAEGRNLKLTVTAVVGVYPVEAGVRSMGILMQKSSLAYDTAKNILKKDVLIYSEVIEQKIMHGKKIRYYFGRALDNKEFLVYYQPKVDSELMDMIGAEALVRWKYEGRIEPPSWFIPILDEDDNICQLDFYVLDRVCQDIRAWIDEKVEPVRISVNFSRRHLTNESFVDKIVRTIDKYGIPRKYIEIEITETTTEEQQSVLVNVVKRLHEENICVSIDDFGTGYSSLNMIRRLDADILKIDRSFIMDAVRSEKDRIILRNIIKLSAELGMNVIIEGVETSEQLTLLKNMDCNLIQGFLFDKPLDKEAFNRKMQDRHYSIG